MVYIDDVLNISALFIVVGLVYIISGPGGGRIHLVRIEIIIRRAGMFEIDSRQRNGRRAPVAALVIKINTRHHAVAQAANPEITDKILLYLRTVVREILLLHALLQGAVGLTYQLCNITIRRRKRTGKICLRFPL